MDKKFQNDLVEIYDLTGKKQKELGSFYRLVEDDRYSNEKLSRYIDEFLDECDLGHSKENYLALLSRLIGLRDEQFVQVLQKQNNSKADIEKKRALAYLWTKNFHIKKHEEFLQEIEKRELLNSFYRALLRGVHEVGLILSDWQYSWNEHIINHINPKLKATYGDKVMDFLTHNNLFDKDENGDLADRSYSVLVEFKDGYRVEAYSEFFKDETKRVCKKLDDLIDILGGLEDLQTGQKEYYIDYFYSLKKAFGERDRVMLLARWRDVDRAWMRVTSPIQVGHPLEYYEDHYRKAVALEWDIRVSNPKSLGANKTLEAIEYMYNTLFDEVGKDFMHVKYRTKENLKRVQLYIGRPALFYASEFNGLFSAQVVPNDEQVSKEDGKKIFAFADNILDAQRAKPFLKIDRLVFGDDFMQKERNLIFRKGKIWHKVYEISTIGHEFGHILWLDKDSETAMNRGGVFKNIEEFKATTGGLVAFFMCEDEQIKEYVFLELIKRAVGLIAWRKTGEVEPYYCEGLIHLKALFDSGVLSFKEELSLHIEDETYEKLKKWYLKRYKELASHYLHKREAGEFLSRFACKKNDDYMPIDREIYSFVEYYWALHQDIGREIDDMTDKSEWV